MDTKRIDLPHGWSATIIARDWLSERSAREISRALVDSVAVGAKLNKAGFDDANPDTCGAFSELSEVERNSLTAFQTVILCQFVTTMNTGTDIIEGPLSVDAVEGLPQVVFDALASACLEEWNPKAEETLDPKAPTDA